MASTTKKKLSKLRMPEKKNYGLSDEDMASLKDDESNESPEDEANESPEYQKMEDELGIEQHGDHSQDGDDMSDDADADHSDSEDTEHDESDMDAEGGDGDESEGDEDGGGSSDHSEYLGKCSDDDLIAEIKKRGLMGELMHGSPEDDSGAGNTDSDHSMY